VSAIAHTSRKAANDVSFRCHTCETPFSETRETVFFDLRTSEEKVMMALKMLLVRVDLTGIQLCAWRDGSDGVGLAQAGGPSGRSDQPPSAAEPPGDQVQLDEMWNFIARKHARETDEAGESLPEGQDGRQWSGQLCPRVSVDDRGRVGPRTLDMAKEVVALTKGRRGGDPGVLQRRLHVLSGSAHCAFHVVTTFAPTGKRGRPTQAALVSPIRIWSTGS